MNDLPDSAAPRASGQLSDRHELSGTSSTPDETREKGSASESQSSVTPASPSRFARSAILMILGTGGSQLVILATLPVLARIYEPEAIGAYAVFVAASGTLAVLCTLRLDLALVLPVRDEDAAEVAGLAVLQSLLVGGAVTLVGVGCLVIEALVWGQATVPLGAWLLPFAIVLAAVQQIGVGLATRAGRFGRITMANMVLSLGFAFVAISIGLIDPVDIGVVTGRLSGQILAGMVLVLGMFQTWRTVAKWMRRPAAKRIWRNNRQFLMFNTPYSLVGATARDFPLYLLGAFAGVGVAASYALARSVTLAPTTLLSSALSSVFFREAARDWGSPRLEALAQQLTRVGLTAVAPAFAFVFVCGPQLFTTVFGDRWELAGTLAGALAIPLWLALQNGWPERVFEVAQRQRLSFTLQLGFDGLHVVVVSMSYWISQEASTTVAWFAASYTLYQLTYLWFVYGVAGFDRRTLLRSLVQGGLVFLLSALLISFSGFQSEDSAAIPFGVALTLCLVLAASYAVKMRRPAQTAPSTTIERK